VGARRDLDHRYGSLADVVRRDGDSFSTERVQVGYARIRKPIDAVMGTVLLGLGAKLALDR
jgi:hypothetical protein